MEHGAYVFLGSGVDEKPIVTSDSGNSNLAMGNGTVEYKELRYNMLSMLVKVTL